MINRKHRKEEKGTEGNKKREQKRKQDRQKCDRILTKKEGT